MDEYEDEDDAGRPQQSELGVAQEVLRNAAQKEKQSNENDTEEENNTFDDPKEYRKLMVKLPRIYRIHSRSWGG